MGVVQWNVVDHILYKEDPLNYCMDLRCLCKFWCFLRSRCCLCAIHFQYRWYHLSTGISCILLGRRATSHSDRKIDCCCCLIKCKKARGDTLAFTALDRMLYDLLHTKWLGGNGGPELWSLVPQDILRCSFSYESSNWKIVKVQEVWATCLLNLSSTLD